MSLSSDSQLWNELHKDRMPDDTWPTDDMIRQIARHFFKVPDRRALRALDLGCGSGPMTWFLAKSGFTVSAIDGAASAVENCRRRMERERLSAEIVQGEFSALPWPDDTFDFVQETHCLYCNDAQATIAIVSEVFRVIKPGGLFFSRTPADDCWGAECGTHVADGVWRDAPDGPFQGMGLARFMRREEAPALYRPFAVTSVEKTSTTVDNGAHLLSSHIVICRKSMR